jgi:hypothetical protein
MSKIQEGGSGKLIKNLENCFELKRCACNLKFIDDAAKSQ